MKKIYVLIAAAVLAATGCSKTESPSMNLEIEAYVVSMTMNDYPVVVDNGSGTLKVAVPEDFDATLMQVTSLELSEGASASVSIGDELDMTVPRMVTVFNGDVFMDYTLTAVHDAARILSFRLNDEYSGIINETSKTISVRVPSTADLSSMTVTMTLSEGAVSSPASGTAVDFTKPVKFTVTYNTAKVVYTVTVIQSDSPKALYVGLPSTMDGLGPEERTAAEWMLGNIPEAQYASFDDIALSKVDLGKCEVMWWHFHVDGGLDNMSKFDSAAPSALNAVGKMLEFYHSGGNLLLSRYATYYAVKLGATRDNANPNNCWGQVETEAEVVGGPWDFSIAGHESHPLYRNLVMGAGSSDKVYLFDTGYRTTNSTAQWHIGADWGGYPDLEAWRSLHGGVDLAYGGDGAVVIWEYPSDGQNGNILCIGSGCYDWYAHDYDSSADRYHVNVSAMTLNAIDYLNNN